MRLGTYLHQKGQELLDIGEEVESLSFAYRMTKGLTVTDFVLSLGDDLTKDDKGLIDALAQKLKHHVPVQYILGWSVFSGLRLTVTPDVLIPRPETEELVQLILYEAPKKKNLRVLDLCTGSGAIALALKKARPSWQITASDLSYAALRIAKKNAVTHQLAIDFCPSDLFSDLTGKFDIIVSNPPYISRKKQSEVAPNVLYSEPPLALFAGENGLYFYRVIAKEAKRFLTKKGKLYLEIGYQQGKAVQTIFQEQFPKRRLRILQDDFKKDRMAVLDD